MLVSEISDDIYQTASAVLAADQKDALAKLKETLQRFISSNFAVCSGSIVDESGNRSSFFSIIICRVDNVFQPSDQRAGPGCLNKNSASISGASAGVRPPRGAAEG